MAKQDPTTSVYDSQVYLTIPRPGDDSEHIPISITIAGEAFPMTMVFNSLDLSDERAVADAAHAGARDYCRLIGPIIEAKLSDFFEDKSDAARKGDAS